MISVEISTIIATIISTICIPIIIEWLKNKSENRKLSSEQLKLDLENAKEFQQIKISNQNALVKDRSAKKTFNNKTLTFEEVEFFSKYIHVDYWVIEYLKVKTQLKAIRSSHNEIIEFDQTFTDSDIKKNIFWYVIYTVLFSLPFVFINKSKILVTKALHQDAYLVLLLFLVLYIALFVGIVTTLTIGRKRAKAKIFIKDLNANALVRVESQIED